jgi:outer membrane protein OmpA-like peptidoglycan-associated protein
MKIRIKESQYNALLERKVVKSIMEKIEHSKKTLNESEQIDEAISSTLKDYLRKGLLTVGVIAGLMANNVSAQELQSAGVPQENIAQAEQMVKGKQIDLNQIEKAFIRNAEKSDRVVLDRYNKLPQEKKIAVLKAIRNNIDKLSDINKIDFGLLIGSKASPEQVGGRMQNIGKEIVKVVSVDTVYTTSSTPVGNYFALNSSELQNTEELQSKLQEIMDSYTKVDKIEIVSSSSTLRNTRESEGKTWLELSTERADAVKNVLVGMKTSCGGCGVNATEINEQIVSNPNGTNGDGTSGPKSPYEVNPKYVQAYQEKGIDPKFWQSAAQDAPLENIEDYKQFQYVNVVVTGTVMIDKVEEMPNYDYLSMRIKQEGGKIKPQKKAGKQDISVCKIKVPKVKMQKMKF